MIRVAISELSDGWYIHAELIRRVRAGHLNARVGVVADLLTDVTRFGPRASRSENTWALLRKLAHEEIDPAVCRWRKDADHAARVARGHESGRKRKVDAVLDAAMKRYSSDD